MYVRRYFLQSLVMLATTLAATWTFSQSAPDWHLGGNAKTAAVNGTTLYIGQGKALSSAKIENNILQPQGSMFLPMSPAIVKVYGTLVLVSGDNTLVIGDITDPVQPKALAAITLGQPGDKILDYDVHNNRLYVCQFNSSAKTGTFSIYDIANAGNPVFLGNLAMVCQSVAVGGATAFVITGHASTGTQELASYNVADPAHITLRHKIQTSGAERVAIQGNYAYTGGSGQSGLRIINIANPDNLQLIKDRIGTISPIRIIKPLGHYVYAASWTDVCVFDVGNPASPALTGVVKTGNLTINELDLWNPDGHKLLGLCLPHMAMVDLSMPNAPTLLPAIDYFGTATALTTEGANLYATDNVHVWHYDLENDQKQTLLFNAQGHRMLAHNQTLFITTLALQGTGDRNLEIYNVADIHAPVKQGVLTLGYAVQKLAAADHLLCLVASTIAQGVHRVEFIDVGDPMTPQKRSQVLLPGAGIDACLVKRDSTFYLLVTFFNPTDNQRGFVTIDISDAAHPQTIDTTATAGKPTGICTVQKVGIVSSIDLDKKGFYLQAFNLSNLRQPELLAHLDESQSNNTLVDVEAIEGVVYAASPELGLITYHLRPNLPIEKIQSARSNSAQTDLFWFFYQQYITLIVEPLAEIELIGNIFAGDVPAILALVGFSAYGDYYRKGYEGIYGQPQPPPPNRPSWGATLTTLLAPAEAAAHGCSVNPDVGEHDYLYGMPAFLQATDNQADGWFFSEWTGMVGGRSPSTMTIMDRDKFAIANFIELSLTVSGTKPRRSLCPETAEQKLEHMLPITFTASPVDDWIVQRVTLQPFGSGNDGRDIIWLEVREAAHSFYHGPFVGDDCELEVSFNPPLFITKGTSRTVDVNYQFNINLIEFAKDSLFTFLLHTKTVTAVPVSFETGNIIGRASSDTLYVGRTRNSRGWGFKTIQQAIAANTTLNGDSCIVCEGLFLENVDVNKELTLCSERGAEFSFLQDPDGHDLNFDLLHTNRNNVTVQGLTFSGKSHHVNAIGAGDCRNISIKENKFDSTFNAVSLARCRNGSVMHNQFKANPYTSGESVGLHGTADMTVAENSFTGVNPDEPTVLFNRADSNTFSANISLEPLLIELDHSHGNRISNTHIAENVATARVVLKESNRNHLQSNTRLNFRLELAHDNVLSDNACREIQLIGSSRNTIQRNEIAAGPSWGIAIYERTFDEPQHNHIWENNIHDHAQAGLYITNMSGGSIRNNRIHHNSLTASHPIGGVDINRSNRIAVEDNYIHHNWGHGLRVAYCQRIHIEDNRITFHNQGDEFLGFQPSGILLYETNHCYVGSNQLLQNCSGLTDYESENLHLYINVFNDNFCYFTGLALNGTQGILAGNTIMRNNGYGLACHKGAQPLIYYNAFSENIGHDLGNTDPTVLVQADNNWWGSANGPAANQLEGRIKADAWLTQPPGLLLFKQYDPFHLAPGESDSNRIWLHNLQTPGDLVEITLSDDLGWLQHPGTITLSLNDSVGAAVSALLSVPAAAEINSINMVRLVAKSHSSPHMVAIDSFLVKAYEPALQKIKIQPDSTSVVMGDGVRFHALGLDQTDHIFPVKFTWTAGGGIVDSLGNFTAGQTVGCFSVSATDPITGLQGHAVVVITSPSQVARNSAAIPAAFSLSQNYPNPFNPLTTISYAVKEPCRVELAVYDVLGRMVRTLVDVQQSPGFYRVEFNAGQLASGLYFYKIRMNSFTAVRKMMLLE